MKRAVRKTPRGKRLLVAWIIVLCATAATPAQDMADSPFILKQVGPNVWAAINNPDAKAQAFANGGFVIVRVTRQGSCRETCPSDRRTRIHLAPQA